MYVGQQNCLFQDVNEYCGFHFCSKITYITNSLDDCAIKHENSKTFKVDSIKRSSIPRLYFNYLFSELYKMQLFCNSKLRGKRKPFKTSIYDSKISHSTNHEYPSNQNEIRRNHSTLKENARKTRNRGNKAARCNNKLHRHVDPSTQQGSHVGSDRRVKSYLVSVDTQFSSGSNAASRFGRVKFTLNQEI